jgi:hypothetical protein
MGLRVVILGLVLVVAGKAAAATYDLGDVVIEVSDPVLLSKTDEGRHWFPGIVQLDRDNLIVSITRSADEINPDAIKSVRQSSKDGGRTWSEPEAWKEDGNSWLRLKDGTCLWLSYLLMYQSASVARLRIGRSRDGLAYTWAEGTVDVSPHKFSPAAKGTASIVVHRSILEMPDGALLATMYGRFAGDPLDRSILASSTDGGTTWKFLSTIGFDPNVGGEGLNEPCMVRLANGELFCFMRNVSGKPMYSARSTDGGKTWSPPQRMPDEYAALSVDPDLVLMSDGTPACSAGRPGCHVMFSLDGAGKTWTKPVTIFTGSSTSYTSIREVAPGRLFFLHDVTPAGWEVPKKGQFHEVRGAFVTLRRKEGRTAMKALDYEIKLAVPREEFDGTFCWFHPRAAAIPGAGKDGRSAVILTLQKHLLPGDDYYSGLFVMRSDDLGATWTNPDPRPELGWRTEPGDVTWAVCDVTPGWHAPTGKLLAIGHTVRYKNGRLADLPRARETAYAVYDPKTGIWSTWDLLKMPEGDKFFSSGAGCAQWIVEPDGTLLVPIYVTPRSTDPNACSMTTVVRCAFDGAALTYREHGDEITLDVPRGCDEPSLTRFQGKYYLTIRNDQRGYATVGNDGLYFAPIKPWTFDDGADLGSYNTQQHWVTHSEGLFLAYTRRGANNDHIFRNRAPLFIAQVDPDKLCVLRATERILMPERGATLGNFGTCNVTETESWVTDAEGMFFPEVYKKGGARGAVFAAKLLWSKPNRLVR